MAGQIFDGSSAASYQSLNCKSDEGNLYEHTKAVSRTAVSYVNADKRENPLLFPLSMLSSTCTAVPCVNANKHESPFAST